MERHSLITALLVVTFAATSLEARVKRGDWRIIGGSVSTLGQHPWQAAILYTPDFRSVKYICGGALIDATTVVTAAHCFDENEDPKHYLVTTGTLSLKTKFQEKRTTRAIKLTFHEDRLFDPDGYDIAIIKLRKPLLLDEYASALALPESVNDRAKVNDTCYVAGWGATTPTQGKQSSTALLYTDLKIRNNAYCDRVYPRSRVQAEHVCAGGYTTNKNACKGDSGSPLVCMRNGHWVFEGVLSYGQRICGKYGIPTVYTSIAYYRDWIEEFRV
ncbi:plasma kallikrein-like [Tubulanus polymorphus]|uniref:plasma kallikrein-like n=1 Tax=Tubulanus polymorphus TaxID=672921 RepID=UPI003DA5414B